ncbi:MAG: preprotein translocase subunit SecG [Candidatus Lernaella stagnicola]|nr:preprotein translocase subunit SecG [Candidatus Lernaella stagnicola]
MLLMIVSVIHVLICIALILVILLQAGKGADLGAMLGGAGSHTMFGGSGAGNFLTRATTVVAVVFMLTCLGLAYLSARSGTVTDQADDAATLPISDPAPGATAPAAATPDAANAPATGDAGPSDETDAAAAPAAGDAKPASAPGSDSPGDG